MTDLGLFGDDVEPAQEAPVSASVSRKKNKAILVRCPDREGAAVWLPGGAVLRAGESVELAPDIAADLLARGVVING